MNHQVLGRTLVAFGLGLSEGSSAEDQILFGFVSRVFHLRGRKVVPANRFLRRLSS